MINAGGFTFDFNMVDLFLALKSNLGFMISQRLSIYNHIRGCIGIGSLEFQSPHQFPITNE